MLSVIEPELCSALGVLAGQLPALERDDELAEGGSDEFACARAALEYLALHGTDLDAHLSSAERAEVAAFRCSLPLPVTSFLAVCLWQPCSDLLGTAPVWTPT